MSEGTAVLQIENFRNAVHKARGRARVVLLRPIARLRRNRSLRPPETAERILWVRLDHIGDAILSWPALQALRKRYPGALIDAVVNPVCAPLYADQPGVRKVYTYATTQFGRDSRAQSRIKLLLELRANRYDLAIETRGDDASRVLAFLAGARRIAGPAVGPYESPGVENCSFLLTDSVAPARMPRFPCHASDISLGILEELGIASAETLVTRTIEADRCEENVARILAGLGVDRPFAAIHAAPSAQYKSWPVERFAEVASYLVRKHGLAVLLTGACADKELNQTIIDQANESGAKVIDAAGKFGLLDLPALFCQARLVLAVDTGPMHIAAAVQAPIVALMLPWHAPIFHPYGQADAVVCSPPPEEWLTIDDPERSTRYHKLHGEMPLSAVQIQDVIEAVDRKLAMPMPVASATAGPASDNEGPFFSIIIPTFNSGEKLARTLDSALRQEGASYEILIMDGASTDDTLNTVKLYSERHPNVIRWKSEKDEGVYDAMNKGIDAAQGKYLYFLGAGDTLRPGVLARISEMAPAQGAAFVYGNVYYANQDRIGEGEFSRLDFFRNNICHQAIFYHRAVFDLVGKYDTRYRTYADRVVNMRCFRAKAIRKAYADVVIANYEEGGISDTMVDEAFARDLPMLMARCAGVRIRERPFFVIERALAERIKSARGVLSRRFWHAQLWMLHTLVRPLLPAHLRVLRADSGLEIQYDIRLLDEV